MEKGNRKKELKAGRKKESEREINRTREDGTISDTKRLTK